MPCPWSESELKQQVSEIVGEYAHTASELDALKTRHARAESALFRLLRASGKGLVFGNHLFSLEVGYEGRDRIVCVPVLSAYGVKVSDLVPVAPTVEDAEFGPKHGDRIEPAGAQAADLTGAFLDRIDAEVA